MRIFFLLIVILGLGYDSWRLYRLLPHVGWLVVVLASAMLLVGGLLSLSMLDRLPLFLSRCLYMSSTSLLMVWVYLLPLLLVMHLCALLRVVPVAWIEGNRLTFLLVLLFVTGIFGYGNYHYHDVKRVALHLNSNGKLSRPVRIVMVSDVHLGYHIGKKEFEEKVRLINAAHPDMVLIAGDLMDISVRPLMEQHLAESIRKIQAPVYACLGNHEYYSGSRLARRFMAETGITLLQDSVASIGNCRIIGRDDRSNKHRKPLAALMDGIRKDSLYTIVLDHQPYHLEEAARNVVDLQLSGHTHYGQIWPISSITRRIYECAYGAYTKGHTHYYVSSGVGIWGGKFRIGTQSEYVVIDIR